jgi:hypothetical protein
VAHNVELVEQDLGLRRFVCATLRKAFHISITMSLILLLFSLPSQA